MRIQPLGITQRSIMEFRKTLRGVLMVGLVVLFSGEVSKVEAVLPPPCGGPGFPSLPINLLQNPGFEAGDNGVWSPLENIQFGSGAHRGQYHAVLNGQGHTSAEVLYQQVSIPANVSSAQLSFYLKAVTEESGARVYDTLHVLVYPQYCSTICWPFPTPQYLPGEELAVYSNVDNSSDYRYHTFDLTRFKGRTVFITFAGYEDVSLRTWFHLDDVALTVPPRCSPF